MSTPRQNTIRASREAEGVGLHTGASTRLRFLPAPVHTGVVFRRVDLPGSPEVPALVANVVDTDRGTTLGVGEARVHTVEHLLAATVALGIDNLVVELDAHEPPAGDGSAKLFHDLLSGAGVEEQDAPARVLAIDEAFSVEEKGASYVVAPSPDYRVSTTIEFEHPLILRQFGSFRITPESFGRDMAPARTFCYEHEVAALRERGLARGGTPDNAVVLSETGLVEGMQLRFPDEFVRHKTLDLVGDLALVGARLAAHVVAERPGHRGNVALARELVSRQEKKALSRPILNVEQIMHYLPHRYPFLLVDRVVEFEERKRIVGLKNVTINEPFFQGHFPGRPVMPGVLMVEAMAQVGGLLVLENVENLEDKVIYFLGVDGVRWRRPVTPGDQLRFEVELVQVRGATVKMRGVGTVDGQLAVEAEMMARVVDR
ncbi:MAG TPA: bifunctional UDP-3-O-[3-hydroxymyristoyl] N-acetylglucosamine deacetylase/3-hydroxyacyl-ACP dehydratase [Longimicrobiaceae bacterium]|nr:bifunctional UDP-3-O-[3-hydroxymyristoyl] N-acetylglucosamine deacetylase/3-hydroxyacyl-ACP dehydratase [Longimicrobiaceae bacterium]